MLRVLILILASSLVTCGPGVITSRNSNTSFTPVITKVQSLPEAAITSASSNTIVFSTSQPKVGNLIIVFIATNAAADSMSSVVDNYSNSYYSAGIASEANGLGAIYYTVVAHTGPSLTITVTHTISGKISLGAIEFSGIQQGASAIDMMNIATGTSLTSGGCGLTTTRSNDLIVTMIETSPGAAATITPTFTNWNFEYLEVGGSSYAPFSVYWTVASIPGTYGGFWNYTPTSNYGSVTAAFKGY